MKFSRSILILAASIFLLSTALTFAYDSPTHTISEIIVNAALNMGGNALLNVDWENSDTTGLNIPTTGGGSDILMPITSVLVKNNIDDLKTGKGVYVDKTSPESIMVGTDDWDWTTGLVDYVSIESYQPAPDNNEVYILYKKTNNNYRYISVNVVDKTIDVLIDEIPELWFVDGTYTNSKSRTPYYVTLTQDGNYIISSAQTGKDHISFPRYGRWYVVAQIRDTNHNVISNYQTIRRSFNDGDKEAYVSITSSTSRYFARSDTTQTWLHYSVIFNLCKGDPDDYEEGEADFISFKWDGAVLSDVIDEAISDGESFDKNDGEDFDTYGIVGVQYSSKHPDDAVLYVRFNTNEDESDGDEEEQLYFYKKEVGLYSGTKTQLYYSDSGSVETTGAYYALAANANTMGAYIGWTRRDAGDNEKSNFRLIISDEDFAVHNMDHTCSGGKYACYYDSVSKFYRIPDGFYVMLDHRYNYPAAHTYKAIGYREDKTVFTATDTALNDEFINGPEVSFKTNPDEIPVVFGPVISCWTDSTVTQWEYTLDPTKIGSLSQVYTLIESALARSYLYYDMSYFDDLEASFEYYDGTDWISGSGSVQSLGFVPEKIRIKLNNGFSFNWPFLVFLYN